MRTRNVKLQQKVNNSNRSTIVSNVFFIAGTCIILTALIYMIVNLNNADTIIKIWGSVMVVGLSLTFWGLLLRLWDKRQSIYLKKYYTFGK